jgi:hypothetical protein
MSCQICVERMKNPITCFSCEYTVCQVCVETYLLTIITPVCMNCKSEWNRTFIYKNCSKKFSEDQYLKHCAKIQFQQEFARLPEDQERAKRIGKIDALTEKIRKLQAKLASLQQEVPVKIVKEGKRYLGSCPYPECTGFIDNSFQCGICEKKSCKKCLLPLHEDACKPENVETAKLLKECHPCPNCKVPIHKIDGCDQIWCTKCHTTFSWKTGEVEQGRTHNPHYYEWLRRTKGSVPREPEPQPEQPHCEQRLVHVNFIFGIKNLTESEIDWLSSAHRFVVHIQSRIDKLNRERTNVQSNARQRRINYLNKWLGKYEWQEQIASELKNDEKIRCKIDIYQLIASVLTDSFNASVRQGSLTPFRTSITDFIPFINAHLSAMSVRFKIRKVQLNQWFETYGF